MTVLPQPRILIIRARDISKIPTLEETLVNTLNRGYNKPRFKYEVILSQRVKYTILQDIAEGDEDCLLLICLMPLKSETKLFDTPSDMDASQFTERLLEDYPLGSFQMDYRQELHEVLEVGLDEFLKNSLESLKELSKNPLFESSVLGTSGIKSKKPSDDKKESIRSDGFELTGFTSFYPGVSSYLMNYSMGFSKEVLNSKRLVSCAIKEHQLEDYYTRFGFVTVDTILCKVDPTTNRLVGGDLEDGVLASRDFNLVVMIADL